MISWIAKKILGTKNQREIKKLNGIIAAINAAEPALQDLSDEQLAHRTVVLKERLQELLQGGMSEADALNKLLPEAFATAREAGRRTLGMRHFDVQLVGGVVMHQGKIAEMKTGEGKTLVATLPVYLNALTGRGVHVITVNDYLASRDAEWMGKIYRFLGLTVGVITNEKSNAERKEAYACDVTYGTNNEFGFDYLRDNMKYSLEEYVQRDPYYAIVDEVDSILIDEARTPLIISGPTEQNTELYYMINSRVLKLIEAEKVLDTDPTVDPDKEPDLAGKYFRVDLEHRNAMLTEEGVHKMEEILEVDNLYAPDEIETLHHVNQALSAHSLYERDREYVVQNGEVVIVDEFTGRLMDGRRWSDGLHQAVEAKEGVQIQNENQTLATITFQNYFKMYDKLAGMTGTADTEAAEFSTIYNLDVVVIPTNKPIARIDETDLIFKRDDYKHKALVEDVGAIHETGAPILIGTTSVDSSEMLSRQLVRGGIKHEVLNAKQHAREAEIVAQAGRIGAVTIATNMAGRGTDIVLGGNAEHFAWTRLQARDFDRSDLLGDQFIRAVLMHNEDLARNLAQEDERLDDDLIKEIAAARDESEAERKKVVEAGGLHIFGTERHESRRVDNQLRGRAGRQGDPGASRFYLSLEDPLIKVFGGERIIKVMERLGMEDEAIEHPLLNRSIENAQTRVESRNFEIRKNLLEYDDVMNSQRKTIYAERRAILGRERLRDRIEESAKDLVWDWMDLWVPQKSYPEEWDWTGLRERFQQTTGLEYPMPDEETMQNLRDNDLADDLTVKLTEKLASKSEELGEKLYDDFLQFSMLQVVDNLWRDHLLAMDHLRTGIGLQGYAQKDPKQEYQKQGFAMFQNMIGLLRQETVARACRVQLARPEEMDLDVSQLDRNAKTVEQHATTQNVSEATQAAQRQAAPTAGGNIHQALRNAQPAQATPQPTQNQPRHVEKKAKPNDPCPCGSGKKYKRCHGRIA